jgi:hypothetical protein
MTQFYSGPEYGTVEFYSKQFADIIADVQHDSPQISDNLIEGFKLALTEWKEYYQKQVDECERVESKFNETFND